MAKEDTAKKEVTEELENVELESDDFFEKILNEDIPIPTEDDEDAGADASDKKVVDKSEEDHVKGELETVDSLKARIAELERENKGRLNDVVKSRESKREMREELDELKSAVISLLQRRNDAVSDEDEEHTESKKAPLTDTRKKIEFDENNDAFVDLSEVKEALAAETASLKQEQQKLAEQRALEEAQKAFAENVRKVVSTDEKRLAPAYDKVGEMYTDLNEAVKALQMRTGIKGDPKDGTLSQERALELLDGSPEEQEYLKKYPGIDPTRVARAFNSTYDLKIGLRHIADVFKLGEDGEADTLDDKIKAAKNKPGSLAGHENRTSDAGSLIERIAGLSHRDLEDLSDAEAAKIEQMLLREELRQN